MDELAFVCPAHVRKAIIDTQGEFFEKIAHLDPDKLANDLLDPLKAKQQAAGLESYTELRGKKVLEVGAGLAMNMIIWQKYYGADTTGLEPDTFGFDSSFALGRELAATNGLDPERIVNGTGENMPFPDNSFDVVFSANVLEHTENPEKVLNEALRVLRPNGVLQFVFPNYCSYYDGHYGVFHPPVLLRGFFPWYVKWIWHRDPAFARTLRTELNVGWVKRQLVLLRKDYRFEVLGLGEKLFLDRMTSLDFATWATLGRVRRVLGWLGNGAMRRWLGKMVIGLRGWTPIVLTLRRVA